jgi:sugar lactone lactonase YvrE
VFKVPASGGAFASVPSGASLVNPVGIAISGDNQTLFIADRSAGIFKLAASGGTATVLSGTESSHPRGVEVAASGSADLVYFTGDEATTGTAGVFTIPPSGGAVATLAKGSPFLQPTGVAVASSGDVYVSNPATFGPRPGPGSVLKISAGAVSVVTSGLPFGYPAGVALNRANSTLLVSGLDTTMSHAAVYAINLTSTMVTSYSQGIDQIPGAGGLHRAATVDVFSWAGSCGATNCGDIVFKVKTN